MEESVLAREASPNTPRPRRTAAEERTTSAHGARAQARSLGQLLGSQLVVSACGLASLPILARNLGPEAYGRFSVFVLALGVLSNLDVARPILVREMSRTDGDGSTGRDEPATTLAATSGWLLAAVSLGLGWVLGGPRVGGVRAAATFLHALTAAPFARLSAAGRVGVAGAVRNGFWALALVVVVALSFTTTAPHAWVWAFLGANALILTVLLRIAPSSSPTLRAPRARAFVGFSSWSTDVLLFALAAAVVTSCDKLLLQGNASEASFGRYAAQYDLAIKINILSTALSSVLYPAFSRLYADRGDAAASEHFLRVSGRIAACYFVGIAALIALHEPILRLVLGEGFAAGFAAGGELQVYALMLVGVFVHLFGFLITPLQRARGDFRTHRSVYVVSAALMIVGGLFAIPAYGPAGAVVAYLTARTAEVALVAYELRRATPGPLRTRSILGFIAMLGTLIALAALALGGVFDGIFLEAAGGAR